MAEELIVGGESKKERYSTLLPQVEALINHDSYGSAFIASWAMSWFSVPFRVRWLVRA